MANLRFGRPSCIRAAFGATSARAGFQKRQRNTLHRLKANHKRTTWTLSKVSGERTVPQVACHRPSHTLKSKSPEVHSEDPLPSETPGLVVKAAGGAPAPLGDNDVDMQPAEMTEEGWGPLLPAVEPPETGRRAQGRARLLRPALRLGSERDKGPKLSLSKRKLDLLLAEPEKRKRKKQYVA